jgi:hypothetical protein
MSTTTSQGAGQPTPHKVVGEWFWRFLAAVMLFSVAWVLWISYQLNPTPLVTALAFEAAEKAKANQNQNASGLIKPPVEAPSLWQRNRRSTSRSSSYRTRSARPRRRRRRRIKLRRA